ncbi:MAG: DNA topoisomerase IV subunit A [Candidatus Anstonellales archaeon]
MVKPLEKLNDFGKNLAERIIRGEEPSFELPVRSRSNVVFDPSVGYLRLGQNKEVRKYLSLSQAKKFMQTLSVAAKVKKFVKEGLHTSIRGLYYQLKFTLGEDIDEDLFTEQEESNVLIEDLESALTLKREDFNLTTDRKGVMAGPIMLIDKFAGETIEIDGTRQGRSGWAVPSDVDNGIEIKKIEADYVLVVEKDALWQRLNEDKFWDKNNCILITPKGQASRGVRRLIRKLADAGLPIYFFTDCDAWGWYIYWTAKTGSMNLAYLGRDFAVPEAKFLGVTMSDIKEFDFLQKLTIKAKDIDLRRAQELLSYEWIGRYKDWQKELNLVLKEKKKLEQDALQGPRLTFVGDYVEQKIKKKEFLS